MESARKAFIWTVVAVAVVAVALALWKVRVVIALFFLAMIISAAMRPGVEWLHVRRVPRTVGILVHYLGLLVVVALLLWLIVPQAITQVQEALAAPAGQSQLKQAAAHTHGIEHDFLLGLDRRLRHLPSGAALVHPALSITKTALEVLVGVFFTFAVAAYWIFEREWAERLVLSLVAPGRRRIVSETWLLVDAKLGAYVRGMLLMIGFVSTVLSVAFWALGLPYWLLLGVFAGIVEIVPVVGPLIAGVVVVGVALTQSWQTALLAAGVLYGLRLLQDYVINPHVFGHAVGLSPLIVLITVSAVSILFGPFYVMLSVPLAAVTATLIEVLLLNRNPADQPLPSVIFPAKERETAA
jgi:predicted PurR-regulated permease PerM